MRMLFLAVFLLLPLCAPLTAGAQTSTEPFTPSEVEKSLVTVFDPKATQENTLSLSAGQEFNDNVNEKSKARSDWVSIVNALGNYSHQSSRLKFSANLDGSYNIYALGNRTNELKGSGQIKATVAVVPELVFLEGDEQFRQVFSNLTSGETNTTDSSRGQVTQNTGVIRAYVTPHFNDRLALKFGTTYTSIIYDSTESNKQYYGVFLQSVYDLLPRFKLTAETEAKRMESQNGGLQKLLCSGGFIWEYGPDGVLQAKGGPRFNQYDGGESHLDLYWNAVLSQGFGRYTITLDTSSIDAENPSSEYSTRTSKAGASLAWKGERATLQARGEYSFLNGQDTTNTEQVNASLTGIYELTPRLTFKASGSRNLSLQTASTKTRWYADASLTYALGERYSLECYYRWKLSQASGGGDDDYTVNRIGLTVKRTF